MPVADRSHLAGLLLRQKKHQGELARLAFSAQSRRQLAAQEHLTTEQARWQADEAVLLQTLQAGNALDTGRLALVRHGVECAQQARARAKQHAATESQACDAARIRMIAALQKIAAGEQKLHELESELRRQQSTREQSEMLDVQSALVAQKTVMSP